MSLARTACLFGLLLALGQAHAAGYQQIKQSGVLRIGTAIEPYPPFTVVQNGKLSGWEYELGNALAQKMGLKPQWVMVPFDDIFTAFRNDKYDIIMASLNPTAAGRKELADFSEPVYCSGDVLISKIGGPQTEASLAGKRLAARRNTIQFETVRETKGLAEVGGFRSDIDAFNQVLYGRFDAMLTDRFVALDFLKKYPKDVKVGPLLLPGYTGIALPKKQPALLKDVNAALKQLRTDGTYAKITARYFPQTIDCPPGTK